MGKIRTNPARRLHTLLEIAVSEVCQNKPVVEALKALFGNPGADTITLYRNFSSFLQLVGHAEQCVRLIKGKQGDAYASCFEPIYSALKAIQFGGSWQINQQTLRKQELSLLELASTALNDVVPEEEIEQAELDSLKTELEAMRTEVGNADTGQGLKAILLEQLTNLIDAIRDYRVGGAQGIKSAVAEAYGRIVVDRSVMIEERENPLVKKFYETVGRIADVAAVALLANQLGEGAVKIFELLTRE